MTRHYSVCWAVATILSVWPSVARGQVQELERPVDKGNALSPPLSLSMSADTELVEIENRGQVQSEVSNFIPPLSGAQDFTPGAREAAHSFLLPALSFYQWADTNSLLTARPSRVVGLSTMLGNLALQCTFRRSAFVLRYSGGGTVAAGQAVPGSNANLNSVVQRLDAAQTGYRRRLKLLMGEQLRYLPESSFGLLLAADTLGEEQPSLRSTVTPDQSIYTGYGGRMSATFLTQGEYRVTPLSTIMVAGAYGTLRFSGANPINSNSALLTLGYNRQFSPSDTAALIYRFNSVRLNKLDGGLDDHIAQVSYGRRITGRLAF